jgi:hypothetical protein
MIANERIQEFVGGGAFVVLVLDCALAVGLIGFLLRALLLRMTPRVSLVLVGAITMLATGGLPLLARRRTYRLGLNEDLQPGRHSREVRSRGLG